ncbi:MAG: ABC transporter substrate-binding protein [Oscillospiraceae bacterium]
MRQERLGLFFESLLVTDEEANVLPNLATGYTVSDDGLTITMELVDNAVFFNGEPVNAEAVVETFNLYMDPEYQHILIDYISGLESVEAVGENTVQFNFSTPNSDFPAAMTTPIGYIMAPSAIETYKSTGDNEVFAREGGCGPFKMTEFIDGESIKTVRNENYFKTDDEGNQLPYLDGVTVQIVSDESVMTQNMLSGDINSLDYFSGITTLAQLQNASNVTVKSLTCVSVLPLHEHVQGPLRQRARARGHVLRREL